MLQFQRDRDAAGGGVVLRSVADAALNDAAATPGLRRADAKAHVLRSIDRLLSDEARTAALESAADAATAGGRCSALVLGAGSLLPALLFARRGAAVCVVEASPLLADVVRAAAVENGVRLAVLSSLASASAAYRQPGVSPPSLLVSEAVDDGLLADGVLPSLRAARALLASSRGGGGDAVAVLPRAASVEASLLQLGFSGVPGFGLDGVDIDLRHFDALRPRGVRARLPPGYWPVRLSEWKQPHRRLSDPLPVCRVDFEQATAPGTPPGAGGAGGVGGPESTVRVEVVEDGLLNAVCYWFTLDLGGGGQVSSAPPKRRDRPGSWRAGWRQAAVYLEEPLHVVRGESVRLAWRVSDEGIRFSARREESASPPPPPPPPPPPQQLAVTAALPCAAYHFAMMADTARNAAYRAAVTRAVERAAARHSPAGCRVLDLGCGAGLLSTIAARAGAAHVDAVEMNDVLAATAAATLSSSGVGSFTVHHCVSTELAVGGGGGGGGGAGRGGARCLAAPADLLVSETLDTSLIGEGALHSLRHAAQHLCRRGAQVIPAAATVYVSVAHLEPPETAGLRFGCLDALREGYTPLRLHTVAHALLAAPREAVRIEFGCAESSAGPTAATRLTATRAGLCNAVVWWFDLHLDEETTISAAPGCAVRTWKQNVTYLGTPLTLERGDGLEVTLLNDGDDNLHVMGVERVQGSRKKENYAR